MKKLLLEILSRIFRLLGINIKDIEIINVPIQFKEIIVPYVLVYPGGYLHCVYRNIFARVTKKSYGGDD